MKSPSLVTITSIFLSILLLYKWTSRRAPVVPQSPSSPPLAASISDDFWSQVKKANFAKKNFKLRAKYCEEKCLYVVDKIEESYRGIQVQRLVTFGESDTDSYVCAHVLKPDPNEIDTSKWQDDHTRMTSDSINSAQIAQIFQSGQLPMSKDIEKNVLVFGTGTGTVFMHLQHHFKKMSITGLEISEKILKIAKEWFSFEPNSQNRFIFLDAKEHVKQSIEEKYLYDIILADVCLEYLNFDKWMCPPPSLYTDEFISNLRKVMKPNGILSMNLLHLDGKPKYDEIKDTFAKYFEHCEFYGVPYSANILLTCYTSKMPAKNGFAFKFLAELGVGN